MGGTITPHLPIMFPPKSSPTSKEFVFLLKKSHKKQQTYTHPLSLHVAEPQNAVWQEPWWQIRQYTFSFANYGWRMRVKCRVTDLELHTYWCVMSNNLCWHMLYCSDHGNDHCLALTADDIVSTVINQFMGTCAEHLLPAPLLECRRRRKQRRS